MNWDTNISHKGKFKICSGNHIVKVITSYWISLIILQSFFSLRVSISNFFYFILFITLLLKLTGCHRKKNFFPVKQSAGITSWCLFQFCGCSFVHYAWATFGNSLGAFPRGWRFLRRLALLVVKNQSVYIKSRLGMKMEPFLQQNTLDCLIYPSGRSSHSISWVVSAIKTRPHLDLCSWTV